jgi:hypothetical protein
VPPKIKERKKRKCGLCVSVGVCIYNRILLSLKKAENLAICGNVIRLVDIILSEISQTEKDKYSMISNM